MHWWGLRGGIGLVGGGDISFSLKNISSYTPASNKWGYTGLQLSVLPSVCPSFCDSVTLFSSPEPKAPGELIVWEAFVVRPHFQTTSSLKPLLQM